MVGTLAPTACTFELRKKAWRVQDAYKEKDSHGVASWQARRPAGTLGMEINVCVCVPEDLGMGRASVLVQL